MPKDNLRFQSFLEDHCWCCLREPSCAKTLDLRDKGKAQGITATAAGYECGEYKRDYGQAH